MKPLFDSEDFAFIGSGERELHDNCRKCGNPASVEIDSSNLSLYAKCSSCGSEVNFVIMNATKRKLSRSGAGMKVTATPNGKIQTLTTESDAARKLGPASFLQVKAEKDRYEVPTLSAARPKILYAESIIDAGGI